MTNPTTNGSDSHSLYDTTLGSTYYVWKPVATSNPTAGYYLYNNQYWDTLSVVESPGLREAIICVGGRSLTATVAAGEVINLIGYLEDAPLDTHVA